MLHHFDIIWLSLLGGRVVLAIAFTEFHYMRLAVSALQDFHSSRDRSAGIVPFRLSPVNHGNIEMWHPRA